MGVAPLNLGEPSGANTHKKLWFCIWPTNAWHSNVRHTPPSILAPFREQGEWQPQLSCRFPLDCSLGVLGLEARHQAITTLRYLGRKYHPRSGTWTTGDRVPGSNLWLLVPLTLMIRYPGALQC